MKKLGLNLMLGLMTFSLANSSLAQTLYWDGGTVDIPANGDGISEGAAGSWDNVTENWDQGSGQPHIAWSSGGDAVFAAPGIAPGAGVVTLNDAITANSMTISTTNYIFTAGGNTANTLTVNGITNSQTTTISNNLVNSDGFNKDGAGVLTLLAASPSLNAPIAVDTGTLTFGNQGTLTGPTAFGDVTINSGATLKFAQGATITYAQNISGTGSVSVSAPSSSVDVILVGNNTFTGSATVNQCTLEVNSINDSTASALGLGTNVFIGQGASASELLYVGYGDTSGRTLTLGGTTPNTILANSGFGPLIWTGPVAFGSTNQHTLTLGGTYTGVNMFGGTITDGSVSNTVLKINGGTWEVTGSNTYSGGTLLSSGTLAVTNDDDLGVSNGPVTFSGNCSLKSTNASVTLGASRLITITNAFTGTFSVLDTNNLNVASYITGPGSVTKGSSSFLLGTVRFSNSTNNFQGVFLAGFGNTEFTSVANSGTPSSLGTGITNSGTIVLGNSTSSGTLRYVGVGNSATTRLLNWTATTGGYALDVTNTGTIAYLATGNLKSGSGSATLTLEGSNTGTNTLAQVINDSGGSTTLSKSGTGTWVLTGANTYTGNTTISGGTLALSGSGSIATSPEIIIGSGAVFDVSGVVGGYALAGGQTLIASNGPNAVIGGSLNLSSAAVVLTNIVNTPTITVSNGTLTLAAGEAFTVNANNGGAPLGAGNYLLIAKTTGGSVAGTAPVAVTIGGDGLAVGATAALSISNNELFLAVSGGTVYPPVISGFGEVGGQAVLSFSGTNGQTWKVLTSTNLITPLTNWSVVTTGTFNGTTVNYTNPVPTDPQRFYLITSP